jgi:hypothetical protein
MRVMEGRWRGDMEGEERHLRMRRGARYARSNGGMRRESSGPGVDWMTRERGRCVEHAARLEKTPYAAAVSNGDRHMNLCMRTSGRGCYLSGRYCLLRRQVGNVNAHFRRGIQ